MQFACLSSVVLKLSFMKAPSAASEIIREITDVADPSCSYQSTTWDSFIGMMALAGGDDIIRPRCNNSWLRMWANSRWPEAMLYFNENDYQGQPPLTNGGLCHRVGVSTKGFILVLPRLRFTWCNRHSNHHPLFASHCFPETFQPCIAFHASIGPLTSMEFPQRSTYRLHGKGANLEIYLVHSQEQRHSKGGPISSLSAGHRYFLAPTQHSPNKKMIHTQKKDSRTQPTKRRKETH